MNFFLFVLFNVFCSILAAFIAVYLTTFFYIALHRKTKDAPFPLIQNGCGGRACRVDQC